VEFGGAPIEATKTSNSAIIPIPVPVLAPTPATAPASPAATPSQIDIKKLERLSKATAAIASFGNQPSRHAERYLAGCGGILLCVGMIMIYCLFTEWIPLNIWTICVTIFFFVLSFRVLSDILKQLQKETERIQKETERRNILLELKNRTQVLPSNTAGEIQKLNDLYSSGVISLEEFERGKSLFLGKPQSATQQILEALSNLQQLMKQGAISESEYNMTKWDLLSGKLVK
jgi:hypothetical protein